MLLYEAFDILVVHQHFAPNLHIGNTAIPDLGPPEPLGCPNLLCELLDRKEPFSGHILGTVGFNHLISLLIFRPIGLDIRFPNSLLN